MTRRETASIDFDDLFRRWVRNEPEDVTYVWQFVDYLIELARGRTISDIHTVGAGANHWKCCKDNAVLKRERDEARADVERKRAVIVEDIAEIKRLADLLAQRDRRIAELVERNGRYAEHIGELDAKVAWEISLKKELAKAAQDFLDYQDQESQHRLVDVLARTALSPAPAQPATATKEERVPCGTCEMWRKDPDRDEPCIQCKRVSNTNTCVPGYCHQCAHNIKAAPPSPAAREAISKMPSPPTGWSDEAFGASAVISSNRNPVEAAAREDRDPKIDT